MTSSYFFSFPHAEQVAEFHQAFGHPVRSRPDISDERLNKARCDFLQEEVDELREALAAGNIPKVLDALCDIQVFLDGTVLALGFGPVFDLAFNEVMSSNMSKLNPDGTVSYREDGKILKGPNYYEPNLADIITAEWPDLTGALYRQVATQEGGVPPREGEQGNDPGSVPGTV